MNFKKNSIVFLVVFMVTIMSSFVNAANEDKFMELLTEKQEFVEIIEDVGKNVSKAKQLEGQLVYDMNDLIEEEDSAEIPVKKIMLDFDLVKESKKESMEFVLNFNDVDFAKGELSLSDKLIAINIEELTDGMIGVNYKELDKLFEKFGMQEDYKELEKVIKQEMNVSQNQNKKVLKVYEKAARKSIKNRVTFEKNVKFVDNEKEYITNKYTVSIDEKMVMDFVINLFEELKKDKSIYNVIIDGVVDETGLTRQEVINELDIVIEEMKQERKELDKEDNQFYNQELLKVSLYEKDGKTLVTEISADSDVMRLKAFRENGTDIIEFEVFDSYFDEDIHIRMTINQSKEKFDAVLRIYGKEVSTTYSIDENMELHTSTTEIYHDIEILKINMNINKKANRKIKQINNQNTFVLNDKSIEEMEQKFMEIESNLVNFEDEEEKAFGEYLALQREKEKFYDFMDKLLYIEMDFFYAYLDATEDMLTNQGEYIPFDNYTIATAIGEKDINKIRNIKKEEYIKNMTDVYSEYELPERLKERKVIKITNPEFMSSELGDLYTDSYGYQLFLAKPYNYNGKLYISEYDVVTLKE